MVSRQSAQVRLVIDCRETALIQELRSQKVPHQVASLPLGDIELSARRHSVDWTTIGIFERKTWSDLASSIVDGRYAEQKTRLMHYAAHDSRAEVGYIVEGGSPPHRLKYSRNITNRVLRKVELSMQLQNCLSVIRTQNVKDTVLAIQVLMDNLPQPSWRVSSCEAPALREAPPPALAKGDLNSSPKNVFVRQLMCVKGVTYETAKLLQSKYTCAAKLRAAIHTKGTIAKLERKSGKRRKLGPKLESALADVFV